MVTKEATRGEWMTITKDETTEETTTKGEKGEGTAATSEEEEGMTAMSSSTFSFYGCPATLSPPKGAWWSRSCTTSPYTPPPPIVLVVIVVVNAEPRPQPGGVCA